MAIQTHGLAGQSTAAALRTLSNLRGLLARNNQRRLGLSLDVKPGFTLWRREMSSSTPAGFRRM